MNPACKLKRQPSRPTDPGNLLKWAAAKRTAVAQKICPTVRIVMVGGSEAEDEFQRAMQEYTQRRWISLLLSRSLPNSPPRSVL
jgi:hypothetical protein